MLNLVIMNKEFEVKILIALVVISFVLNLPKILIIITRRREYILGRWNTVINTISLIGLIIFPISEAIVIVMFLLSYSLGIILILTKLVK